MSFHEKKRPENEWSCEEQEEAYREFLRSLEEPCDFHLSKREIRRIHDRIFGCSKRCSFLRAKKILTFAAAIAAVLSTFVTVAAFQNQLQRFFLHETPIATDVKVIPPDKGENSETITYYWKPAYIPEGYSVFFTDISTIGTMISYRNEQGAGIGVETIPLNSSFTFDTENMQKEEFETNGGSGHLYTTADGYKSNILLIYDDCILLAGGRLSQEELLNIVGSLYKVSIT